MAGCAAPRAWLEVFIKWIYKKGDPDVWTNYRGIALASVILKIYERMLKNRWSRLYLKILRPISWLQDEGADGVDCRHQLWLLQETLAYRLFVLGLNTFCITVDLARAFPSSMREYVALMMWNVGCRGAFLRALWNIWNRVGVRLATSDGCYSDFVAFVRGLLEGRVMSGDGFAVLLDDLRRVLEASGLGVRLVRRDGTEIWVGCVLKTDDVLLMADSEDELRLAYGILKAWAFQFRFDLSYQKHELLRTCLVGDSWAGRTVHWRWTPGELAPYVQSRPRLAEYDLAPETYTYKSSVLYLGCLVDESLDADVSVQSRLQTKAWPIVESTEASVASVSVLQRADALAVTNALFRGAMEYPCGPIALLSGEDDEGGLNAKVDTAYAAALVFVLGDVATHMPGDALLALTGQESLASRRRAGRANFLRALEAVSVDGHRAVVLDIFRSSVSPRFVDASITHAVDGAAAALGLPPRERSLRLSKNEWRARVKAAASRLERDRIRLSLEMGSPGHVPSASRLATALSAQGGPHAPLSMAWRHQFILYRAARGPSSMIMVALSEKYRLVPHVRSHFGSGAPAEGYCDLCRTDLRPGRADIDHVIFECGHAELAAVRDRWTAAAARAVSEAGAAFPPGADRLLAAVGLVRPSSIDAPHTFTDLSVRLANIFISHWGSWEYRHRENIRHLPPSQY